MAIVTIRHQRCKGCGFCSEFCPKHIIILGESRNDLGYHYAVVTAMEQCNACSICAMMCPEVLIEVKEA